MRVAVTTSARPKWKINQKAEKMARDLDIPLILRGNDSIETLLRRNNLDYLMIVEKDRLLMKSSDNQFFWHPSTSVIKIWNANKGSETQIIKATDLQKGETVLDCTLGYGSDAIIMAEAVGESGKVVGLEGNRYIAYMTQDGLYCYDKVREPIKKAMERIEVVHSDYETYLSKLEDESFDVVYFDPMFQMPNKKSTAMNALRDFALLHPLTPEILEVALRVCKKRVVVKERIGGGVFKTLGIKNRVGEIRMGSVVYGYIEK